TNMIQAGSSEWSAILLKHEIYRLFTAMFLHFDIEHLISNMFVLFLIGSFVEHYLGTIKYIIVYLMCGAAGNMLSFYFAIGEPSLILSAGASGAIYGVLGILAVLLWKTKGRLEGIQGPGLVFFVIGMIFHSYQSEGVDYWAHIGGLAMGIILGIVLKRNLNKTAEEAGD
ncbi:MAG: rhomboid family intramembrane serine protease, partial [Lachnospiraceae bacterium]|nr:rhomboid family intramembrane serine protease [Lachnospiraceae bacterium]